MRHIVTELIERKADINMKDRWGGTPLADAIREGHADVARVLISAGSELGYDEVKASGELCEHARNGDLDKIQMLLEGGCLKDAADCMKPAIKPVASSRSCAPLCATFDIHSLFRSFVPYQTTLARAFISLRPRATCILSKL